MQCLHNLRLTQKLTAVILLAGSVSLLLSALGFFTYEFVTLRRTTMGNLATLGPIVSDNLSAALSFNRAEDARRTLLSLKRNPHIVAACVFDTQGRPFATYFSPSDAKPVLPPWVPGDRVYFEGGSLHLFHAVILDGETVGGLYLQSDLGQFYATLRLYGIIAAVVIIASFLTTWLLSFYLQRLISQPILDLANTTRQVSASKDYSLRVATLARDEIGQLIRAFNEMLAQIQARDAALHKSHRQLLETSRQAGQAEVATGVLHNVGNVLNSVNVSATLVSDRLRSSKLARLNKAAILLREHRGDLAAFLTSDPKGALLPDYLIKLAAHLDTERAELLTELELLAKNIEHMKEIVAMQQSYAKVSGLIESLPAADLIDDAIQMNAAAFKRHGIEVVRHFEPGVWITVDKHKALQILMNLLRNAKYAMVEPGAPGEKHLRLSIARNGQDLIRIAVADTGVGIQPENLTQIFSNGFTTKKDGHGFGLHLSALAANQMGGRLTALSEGPGRGATFVLELPAAKEKDRS